MLLFIALSNLVWLLLPALIFARATSPKDPVNLPAHPIKRLPTPLKDLLHKRGFSLAGTANILPGLDLNGTNNGAVKELNFEAEIDIPGLARVIYFLVKGEIDEDYSVTVEFWVHYQSDQRIGVYHGDLKGGTDMKIPASIKVLDGEARLYVVASGKYDVLVFEAYGNVHSPQVSKSVPLFKKEIKRWRAGTLVASSDSRATNTVE